MHSIWTYISCETFPVFVCEKCGLWTADYDTLKDFSCEDVLATLHSHNFVETGYRFETNDRMLINGKPGAKLMVDHQCTECEATAIRITLGGVQMGQMSVLSIKDSDNCQRQRMRKALG